MQLYPVAETTSLSNTGLYEGAFVYKGLYAASLVAISIHSILFLSRLAGPGPLFTLVLLPSLLLILTCFQYAYIAVKPETFRLANQLSNILLLYGLVNVLISLNNIAEFGLLGIDGLVSSLAMLPDLSLMFLGASLKTFEQSGNYRFPNLAFKFLLGSLVVGRVGISLRLYTGDLERLLTGGSLSYFTVGNVVQFVLTFGLVIPMSLYVLLRLFRGSELKSAYIAIVGISYALAFFVPRIFDSFFAALFGFPATVITERLSVFIEGVLMVALFSAIARRRQVPRQIP